MLRVRIPPGLFNTKRPRNRQRGFFLVYAIIWTLWLLERAELFFNLYGRWICHRCSIREDESGDHLVAVVEGFDKGCCLWGLFDVDLLVGDI